MHTGCLFKLFSDVSHWATGKKTTQNSSFFLSLCQCRLGCQIRPLGPWSDFSESCLVRSEKAKMNSYANNFVSLGQGRSQTAFFRSAQTYLDRFFSFLFFFFLRFLNLSLEVDAYSQIKQCLTSDHPMANVCSIQFFVRCVV